MVSAHSTTLLLGLTTATSLFLFTTALPTAIPPHRYPYDSSSASSVEPSSSSSSSRPLSQQHSYGHFYAQDPSARQTKDQANIIVESAGGPLGQDTHAFQGLLHTRPSPSTSWSTPPQPPRTPFSPSRANVQVPSQQQHQQHQNQVDLRVNNFKSHALTSTTAQDQILHQCTTHFLALLDTEISDRLLAQLSRLVMMLPVIGVETRAVIRNQVAQVMQQAVAGLKNYEALGRVIRTAVDDAGVVLVVPPPPEAVEANHGRSSRNSHTPSSRQDDLFAMDNDMYDQISEYDDVDDEILTSTATTITTARTTPTIDESQIPVLTDIAMEAVLDYMAELLTPSLVIHQLTEAIQGALLEISKQRQALHRLRAEQLGGGREDEDRNLEDVNGVDIDLDDFSSQLLRDGRQGNDGSPADRHGVDLLSDGWILAGPSSSSRFKGDDSSLLEDEDEDEDDDPRGQDEDLWDKDMEIHQWDSTGHLFEDFEDLEDNSSSHNDAVDSAVQSVMSTATEQDLENWDMATRTAGDVEEEDDETSDPFSIGIRDSDEVGSGRRGEGTDNDADGEEDEDDYGYGRERYLQQSYFKRFQKRSIFNAAASEPPKPVSAQAPLVKPPTVSTTRPTTTPTPSATRAIRRPNLTPDLRLESLLTQLIEPLLTTFIEEDFPASCKRVQGELMDGIIWSLDQGEFNGAGGSSDGLDSDEERMLLLSELEY